MIGPRFRACVFAPAALALTSMVLAGCGSETSTSSAPPAAATGPPPTTAEPALGKDGKPATSSAAFDSSRGGTPPK